MPKPKPICEVCFFSSPYESPITEIITCNLCKRSAHKYCYLPNITQKFFVCDVCQEKDQTQRQGRKREKDSKEKEKVCSICHNQGLMKKTQQGQYAHPICLILSSQSLVKDYRTLSFYLLRGKKRTKTSKCNICNNASNNQDLVSCNEKKCLNSAHYYCILKQQWKDNQQHNKWVQDLKIYEGNNINSIEVFENQIKRYIKKITVNVYRPIFGEKKIHDQRYSLLAYCRQHSESLGNCYCRDLEEDISKIDWIYCDCCGKWYHFHCQDLSPSQGQTDSQKYRCKCCTLWAAKHSKMQQPILQHYPRLHFYNYTYIQLFAQNKMYRVTNQMAQLLKKVPFLCSILYFNQFGKDKLIIQKVIKSINFMSIKTRFLSGQSGNKQGRGQSKRKRSETKRSQQKIGFNQKLPKNIIDTLWKMDFLTASNPISAINKSKFGEYKVEQIIQIFERYDKRYLSGSNIVRPAIKELKGGDKNKGVKSNISYTNDNGKKEQESDQGDEEDIYQIKEAVRIMRNQIKQLKKVNSSNKNSETIIINFYRKVSNNQTIKQTIKDLIQQNSNTRKQTNSLSQKFPVALQSQQLFQPIFLYESQLQMFHHIRLNTLYSVFKKLDQTQLDNMFRVELLASLLRKCMNQVGKKVKYHNLNIFRQINFITHQTEDQVQTIGRLGGHKNNIKASLLELAKVGKKLQYISYKELQKNLIIISIQNLFKKLDIKASCLNLLYRQYPKICEYFNSQGSQKQNDKYNQMIDESEACGRNEAWSGQPTICEDIEAQYFRPYVRLYESCRKFVDSTNIIQDTKNKYNHNVGLPNMTNNIIISSFSSLNQDQDLLAYIKSTPIQRHIVNRLSQFFIQISHLKLSKLKTQINTTLYEKGLQFLSFLTSRSMIIECQIEFKAAICLINKYSLSRSNQKHTNQNKLSEKHKETITKVQEIIQNNKMLLHILRNFPKNYLDNLVFIDTNQAILAQAQEFCQQNGLQFRLGKIKYARRLLQCKQQAFKYFPIQLIAKNIEEVPKKYVLCQNNIKIKQVDYCLLKKFLYKMKLLRFPSTDYMYSRINQLFNQKTDYFNLLSVLIARYNIKLSSNCGIRPTPNPSNMWLGVQQHNNPQSQLSSTLANNLHLSTPAAQCPKIRKQQLISIIKSKEEQIITCRPQQEQVFLIAEIYDELLCKMDKCLKVIDGGGIVTSSSIMELYREFLNMPFYYEDNQIWIKFCKNIDRISQLKQLFVINQNNFNINQSSHLNNKFNGNTNNIVSINAKDKKVKTIPIQIQANAQQFQRQYRESKNICLDQTDQPHYEQFQQSKPLSKLIKNQIQNPRNKFEQSDVQILSNLNTKNKKNSAELINSSFSSSYSKISSQNSIKNNTYNSIKKSSKDKLNPSYSPIKKEQKGRNPSLNKKTKMVLKK